MSAMSRPKGPERIQTQLMLLPESRAILERLALSQGLTRSQVVEALLRRESANEIEQVPPRRKKVSQAP